MIKEQLAQEYAEVQFGDPRKFGVTDNHELCIEHYLAGYAACEARYADLLAAAEALVNHNGTFELSNGKLWELRKALTNLKK